MVTGFRLFMTRSPFCIDGSFSDKSVMNARGWQCITQAPCRAPFANARAEMKCRGDAATLINLIRGEELLLSRVGVSLTGIEPSPPDEPVCIHVNTKAGDSARRGGLGLIVRWGSALIMSR